MATTSTSIELNCNPCIDRTSYTIRAIFHGTSNDEYWTKLAASARQAALDMRINLQLELYDVNEYSDERMANDIRSTVTSVNEEEKIDALIVTIPSQSVANAVRFVADRGMPIFGLNSGYEQVSDVGGLIEEGTVLFFTAMNERLGGAKAAQYFLGLFSISIDIEDKIDIPSYSNSTNSTTTESEDEVTNSTTRHLISNTENNNSTIHALFITPLGEENSAYQQRFDGYHGTLIKASNSSSSTSIEVEWFELDVSKSNQEEVLNTKLQNCKYQSILVGTGRLAQTVLNAIEMNECQSITKLGTFDTTSTIIDLISKQRMEFAIDQYNHLQGWSPVHFAALYVSTGLVLSPPPEGVYLSGPVLMTREDSTTDTLRICTDDAFPICPNTNGPDGHTPSQCPCTDRKKIQIGGVVHGVTTDVFWDTVFDAAEQGASDMDIDLDFHRFEPSGVLYRRMSAKILSLCQGGVDGIFVSISNELIVEAVKICLELDVPVMSINAGLAESAELNLLHHVGMVRSAYIGKGYHIRVLLNSHEIHSPPLTIGRGECWISSWLENVKHEYIQQRVLPKPRTRSSGS